MNITRDSKLIKVLAAQAAHKNVDIGVAAEADAIIKELCSDITKDNSHMIAQTIAYAVEELQSGSLDFLGRIADEKTVGYGDKAAFRVKDGSIHAYVQAKGATTARSFVTDHQVLVPTKEISARPAMNIVDLRNGRINFADLIREANEEIIRCKVQAIEGVLKSAISTYGSPFYASGTGIVKATLDAQLAYFRRLGPVTILGDMAAVGQLAGLTGMAMNNTTTQYSNDQINEHNANGFIGKYMGCDVVALQNAYKPGTTTPILSVDMLYIVPGGMTSDSRNLKIVNEGGINAFSSQNIDDFNRNRVLKPKGLCKMLSNCWKPFRA